MKWNRNSPERCFLRDFRRLWVYTSGICGIIQLEIFRTEAVALALFIAGDGTALESPEGWGGYVKEKLDGAAVYNAAAAGASSRSFLAEARLQEPEEKMKQGDVLLIQFGWNDASKENWKHTDPFTSYMNCLAIYADTARTWGACPVILTQIPRPVFEGGELQASGGDYPQGARMLARRLGIPVIDVYQRGFEALEKMGGEAAKALYEENAGEEPKLKAAGAKLFGDIVYAGLKEMNLLPEREAAELSGGEKKPAAASWRTEEGGN